MKLYDSIGPNPHVVRMVAAEKSLDLPIVTVDLMAGENRRGEHLIHKKNSMTAPSSPKLPLSPNISRSCIQRPR